MYQIQPLIFPLRDGRIGLMLQYRDPPGPVGPAGNIEGRPMAKVLIADDSALLLKIARAMLEKGGHTVVDAPNGAVAVEKARAEKPDLIILDAEMPVLGGLEALKTLKRDPSTRSIPVSIYSGHDAGGPEEAAFRAAGAASVHSKPYTMESLLALVK